jgi:hypothetical protein
MFKYLRVKKEPEIVPQPERGLTVDSLSGASDAPIRLVELNNLPENVKRRIYRGLLPANILIRYEIDPFTWQGKNGLPLVHLTAQQDSGTVRISARKSENMEDEFFHLEIADNPYQGIDLNFLILSDPDSPYYQTDFDEQGSPTLFGTLRRNRSEELRAMQAGLAPGQNHAGLSSSQDTLQQLEVFLSVLGQRAYFLEPLTYVSAWVFERRGFAYVRGHKLMEDIQREFQPGGQLHQALDGSTPFRQPEQWNSVRGRGWAIHDGILSAIDANWDKLRMIKQVGRSANLETFPDARY